MNGVCLIFALAAIGATVPSAVGAEAPYGFRKRLETVHEPGLKDPGAVRGKDEFAFSDGAVIAVPEDADEVLETAADSRLGWEPTMEYAGGAEQIRWKLERMVETYTDAVKHGAQTP